MGALMKSDIFFFISSVATIVLAILASVVLFYLIKTGRNLYMLSEAFKGDIEESKEFVIELRERLENNILFRLFFPLVPKNRKRRKKKEVPADH